MGQYDVVRGDVGLPVRVAAVAFAEGWGAVVGRVVAEHVHELGHQVGLVERRPEPDPVAERPEADVGEVSVLLPEVDFSKISHRTHAAAGLTLYNSTSCRTVPDSSAQPATESSFQFVRHVEMIQRDEWLYS